MPSLGLLIALLIAASGITGALFTLDTHLGPLMRPGALSATGASTHAMTDKAQLGLRLGMGARTRFVAADAAPPPARAAATPAKPRTALGTPPPAAAKPPARKAQPVKDAQAPKDKAKKPQQAAAAQWPLWPSWKLFGN